MYDTLAEKIRARRAEAATESGASSESTVCFAAEADAPEGTWPRQSVTAAPSSSQNRSVRDHLNGNNASRPDEPGLSTAQCGTQSTAAGSSAAIQSQDAGRLSARTRRNNQPPPKNDGGGRRNRRIPTITISKEAAHALAEMLQILAPRLEVSPLHLGTRPSKDELTAILNLRAVEIRRLMT